MKDSCFSLSVVIAAWPDTANLSDCLSSLETQRDEQTQVIVASAVAPPAELLTRFKWVQWLDPSTDALIPNLWCKGMAAACGEVIAITTGHFVMAPDWLTQVRQAHRRLASAGIGGPIDPPRGGSVVDWATYFLRYSAYLKFDREDVVADIAGDNASYKREAIDAHWQAIREGFWEPDFHRLLRADAKTLTFVPGIRLTQRASFGMWQFCAQRLRHGQHFGSSRLRGASAGMRLARIASSPLIPLVLSGKVGGRVIQSRRDVLPFILSLPVLIVFILAWAAGELWGYLTAPSGRTALPAQRSVST